MMNITTQKYNDVKLNSQWYAEFTKETLAALAKNLPTQPPASLMKKQVISAVDYVMECKLSTWIKIRIAGDVIGYARLDLEVPSQPTLRDIYFRKSKRGNGYYAPVIKHLVKEYDINMIEMMALNSVPDHFEFYSKIGFGNSIPTNDLETYLCTNDCMVDLIERAAADER